MATAFARLISSSIIQHALGVSAAGIGVRRSEHTRQFDAPLFTVQAINPHLRRGAIRLLDDTVLAVSARGNLGKVGDAEGLAAVARLLEKLAHRVRGLSRRPCRVGSMGYPRCG